MAHFRFLPIKPEIDIFGDQTLSRSLDHFLTTISGFDRFLVMKNFKWCNLNNSKLASLWAFCSRYLPDCHFKSKIKTIDIWALNQNFNMPFLRNEIFENCRDFFYYDVQRFFIFMIKWGIKTKAWNLWLTSVIFWNLLAVKCSLEKYSDWKGLGNPFRQCVC